MDDLISRQAAIDMMYKHFGTVATVDVPDGKFWNQAHVIRVLKDEVPPIQPEITHEQAVAYLQSTGWMQEHDRQMMLDGVHRLTAQPEPHWIPVTERLPESAVDDLEYQTVLVCFDNGEVDTACFYESTREWGCGDMYDCICHPIAWMPLPEPYKGVTE